MAKNRPKCLCCNNFHFHHAKMTYENLVFDCIWKYFSNTDQISNTSLFVMLNSNTNTPNFWEPLKDLQERIHCKPLIVFLSIWIPDLENIIIIITTWYVVFHTSSLDIGTGPMRVLKLTGQFGPPVFFFYWSGGPVVLIPYWPPSTFP